MVIYYHPRLVETRTVDQFFLNNYQPLNTIMIILLLTTRLLINC